MLFFIYTVVVGCSCTSIVGFPGRHLYLFKGESLVAFEGKDELTAAELSETVPTTIERIRSLVYVVKLDSWATTLSNITILDTKPC